MRSPRQAPALGWALFSYVLLVTLVITLFPFRFQWPGRIHFLWFGGWSDTLLNVLFFIPLGFLYKLIRPEDSTRTDRRTWIGAQLRNRSGSDFIGGAIPFANGCVD